MEFPENGSNHHFSVELNYRNRLSFLTVWVHSKNYVRFFYEKKWNFYMDIHKYWYFNNMQPGMTCTLKTKCSVIPACSTNRNRPRTVQCECLSHWKYRDHFNTFVLIRYHHTFAARRQKQRVGQVTVRRTSRYQFRIKYFIQIGNIQRLGNCCRRWRTTDQTLLVFRRLKLSMIPSEKRASRYIKQNNRVQLYWRV